MNKIISNEIIHRLHVLFLSLGVITLFMLIVLFIIQFPVIFSDSSSEDKILIEDVQLQAIKATNSPIRRLAIYQNDKKIFTAPCLNSISLCGNENFFLKTTVKKVVGIKQTNSKILVQEIYFSDGRVYKDFNDYEIENFINVEKYQALKSILIFIFSTVIFFVLGIFIGKVRR